MERDERVQELVDALRHLGSAHGTQYSFIQYKDELRLRLSELQQSKAIRPRDMHEIETLVCILDSCTLAEAQDVALERLKVLYVGVTRGWGAAAAFQRRDLDGQLGLPPPTTEGRRGRRRKPDASKAKKT